MYKYKVSVWFYGEIVGVSYWFNSLTEAHFFINRCGALRGYIEKGDTGVIIECFGD